LIGRPALLIPLRINEDQRANAQALARAGGAVLVEQAAGDAALAETLQNLLAAPATLATMAACAGGMGIVDAAARLADLVQGAMARESAL
jgi:UDP-N-acetylglucosamine:LPS N-acetylglucosamine transferase